MKNIILTTDHIFYVDRSKFVQNLKVKTITFCLGAILYSQGTKKKKQKQKQKQKKQKKTKKTKKQKKKKTKQNKTKQKQKQTNKQRDQESN